MSAGARGFGCPAGPGQSLRRRAQSRPRLTPGKEYFNETECRYCKDGFRPDAAGACVAIEYDRCGQVLQNVGTCDYCMDELRVVNGTCLSEDKCEIDNCEVCRRDGGGSYKCARCTSSYGLNSNSECVEFSGGGCEIANTETVCKTCRPGYYYKDGLCPESEFSGARLVLLAGAWALALLAASY